MKTVMLLLVLLFGVAVLLGDQYGASEVSKCASTLEVDLSAAGEDLNKLCQVYRAYVDCIDRAGCSGIATFTAFKKEVSDVCGVAAEGTNPCYITEVSKCASTLEVDLPAVGEDLTKLCQVHRAYIDCIDSAGCSGIADFTAFKKELSDGCGVAVMVADQCDTTELKKCSLKHAYDVFAARGDLNKLRQVFREYADCLDSSGCYGNAAFTAIKKDVSAVCE